jgi:hypothetical protein
MPVKFNPSLPRVGMIYLPKNKVSVKYRDIVKHSWLNAGYEIDFEEGVTPNTIKKYPKLNFGKKTSGRNAGREFTPTEKAVWCSHYMMWDIASRKSKPLIVAEHDVMLLKHIEKADIEKLPIMGLCHMGLLSNKPEKGYRISAGGCYMLTPEIGKKMVDSLPKKIEFNSDAYIHNFISRYGSFRQEHTTQLFLPDLGVTIEHD